MVGSSAAISLTLIWILAIIGKLTKRHSIKSRLRYGHRERSSNPGSIHSFNYPSSVPERCYWRCTEDYSTMRGSLKTAFEGCKKIDQIIH